MTAIVLLLALGIVLVLLEVIVPGGVLGVLGVLAMLGGCVLAFFDLGAQGGWIATAAAVGALGLSLFIEFKLLPRTRWGRKLFLERSIEGASQEKPAEVAIVGKTGEAVTMMAPTGYVTIEGRRYEAVSQSGLIAKGVAVRVVGVNNFHLIVAQL